MAHTVPARTIKFNLRLAVPNLFWARHSYSPASAILIPQILKMLTLPVLILNLPFRLSSINFPSLIHFTVTPVDVKSSHFIRTLLPTDSL